MSTCVSGNGRALTTRAKSVSAASTFLTRRYPDASANRISGSAGVGRLRFVELLRGLGGLARRHQRLRQRQPELYVARCGEVILVRISTAASPSPVCSCDDCQRLQRRAVLDCRRRRPFERLPRILKPAGRDVERRQGSSTPEAGPCGSGSRPSDARRCGDCPRRRQSYGRAEPSHPSPARRHSSTGPQLHRRTRRLRR